MSHLSLTFHTPSFTCLHSLTSSHTLSFPLGAQNHRLGSGVEGLNPDDEDSESIAAPATATYRYELMDQPIDYRTLREQEPAHHKQLHESRHHHGHAERAQTQQGMPGY